MYSKGDIVIISFPFSDLSQAKKRPMLVLATKGKDIIGCAITSNPESEGVLLTEFAEGNLPLESKVKYWQIHTFFNELIIRKIARITAKTQREVLKKIDELMGV